jgi:cytochrome c oxidase subunit 2
VKFSLRSPDVIHSFWIPSFYFKQDVIPGRTNQWTTTPTIEGSFAGKCAELCGISHSRMLFEVEVVSEAEYQEYLDGLAEQGNNGVVVGSTETDEVVGLESEGDEENGASP